MDNERPSEDDIVSDEDNSSIGAHGFQNPPVQTSNFQLPQGNKSTIIQSITELAILGQFEPISAADVTYQMIEKYIHNSHGPPQGAGVKAHNIYKLAGNVNTDDELTSAPKLNPSSPKCVQGNENLLLWLKTTPTGIQKLAQGTDACIALYDRICRAYTEKPAYLKAPLHQIFILCEVSLGRKLKDRNGFRVWSKVGQIPPGFDTVKGMGNLCPDWKENYYEDSATFPCGPTVKHQVYKKYELNFNEYVVFERNRIKVRFAVEVELIPVAFNQLARVRGVNDSDHDEVLAGLGVGGNSTGQPQQRVHPLPSPPKKNLLDPAALQIMMQLPGANSASFPTCLYKAQIITPADEIYDYIKTYIRNGSVHNYKLKILNIIRIVRNNDVEFQHDPKMKGKKRKLLWHGTNDTFVAGILQTGFQIPTAKNQMFGTGIYFADRASKSANYCGDTKRGAVGYLLLCDVAIGKSYNSMNAKNNFTTVPTITTQSGAIRYFDSLKCTGANIPDPKENIDFYGTAIPLGKTIQNTKYTSYTVQYNEFIVYKSSQVKIKYLVKVQFT
ncbi:unnamed protein product [Orchesella dallaii]|uniref:Poly [ADP-ribose] polymerase n=1 Tax=Orchesella dallaii TaxID=48710 RepID=A0ABP1RUJ3_9HEXA